MILASPVYTIDTRVAQLRRVPARESSSERGVKYPHNQDPSSLRRIAETQRRCFNFGKFGHAAEASVPYAKLKQDGPCA